MNIKLLEERKEITLFKEYNTLLSRFKMAMLYLDSKIIEEVEKEKSIPAFQKLVQVLETKLKEIEKLNIEVTSIERQHGFDIDFRVARFRKYNY